ncbi:MAG: ATP synthase F1 subunit gamma [Myxococcota bacterium]|nr:ATP synthase F1 subunit gamma [Myxococcota bacterium]MEC8379435.1 ATP synthase F1 subunit gamma [Myxococcota bacterium]
MASLRDIRRRIKSVTNTRKITRAMKLVAGAKMRKATEKALQAAPYQQTLRRVLERVVAAEEDIEHVLLSVPQNTSDILMVVISSDRGLCGSFNAQLFKFVMKELARYESEGKKVSLVLYGRKAKGFFKSKGVHIEDQHEGLAPEDFSEVAKSLAEQLAVKLKEDACEKAVICFNHFQSVMTQEPVNAQLLPMQIEETEEEENSGFADYLYEPDGEIILSSLLPMALQATILQAFLETEAGEQAARMQAMDNATRNAGDLIDRLTLQYNRARQAAITTELTEIISGAEAL